MHRCVVVACICLAATMCRSGDSQAQAVSANADAKAVLRERDRRRAMAEEYVGEVVVIAKDGRERRKTWRSYRSRGSGGSSRLIRFLSPPDVRGVGYLALFRQGAMPDEWLYLPAMKRERRIGARDREGAFVNTDFSYDDLDLLEFDESKYDPSWLPSETVDGLPAYRIALTSRTPSMYSRKVLTLRQDDLHLLGIDYFVAGNNAPVKRLTPHDYHLVDGYQVASRLEMADFRKGSRTIVFIKDLTINRPQPQGRFTIQNLLREDDEVSPSRPGSSSPLRQQSGNGGPPEALPTWRWPGNFTGYVEGRAFGFYGARADRRSTLWGTVLLRETLHLGPARLVAAARFEEASSDQVGPVRFDPADRSPKRSPITLPELTISFPIGAGMDLQVGRLQRSWGQTDGYSPADAFLPRDLADPLTEERLPLWAVSLQGEHHRVRFEVLAVPTTTPWRLPELGGRQSPFASLRVLLDEQPWRVPRGGFGAARISVPLGRWDTTVWGRGGVRPVPVLVPDLQGVSLTSASSEPVTVPLARHFSQERAAGVTLSRVAGGWTVHGELGLSASPDNDVGRAAIFSLGATHLVRSGTFTATIAANAVEPPVNPLLMFDRALLPCLILATHETESWGSWSAAWLGTFRTVGGVLGLEASRDVTDTVKLTVGAELPHGATLSPAAAFSGGERVRAGLRWSW